MSRVLQLRWLCGAAAARTLQRRVLTTVRARAGTSGVRTGMVAVPTCNHVIARPLSVARRLFAITSKPQPCCFSYHTNTPTTHNMPVCVIIGYGLGAADVTPPPPPPSLPPTRVFILPKRTLQCSCNRSNSLSIFIQFPRNVHALLIHFSRNSLLSQAILDGFLASGTPLHPPSPPCCT